MTDVIKVILNHDKVVAVISNQQEKLAQDVDISPMVLKKNH